MQLLCFRVGDKVCSRCLEVCIIPAVLVFNFFLF